MGAGGGRRGRRFCVIVCGSGLTADAAEAVDATEAADGEGDTADFADASGSAAFVVCAAATLCPAATADIGCEEKSKHHFVCKHAKTCT